MHKIMQCHITLLLLMLLSLQIQAGQNTCENADANDAPSCGQNQPANEPLTVEQVIEKSRQAVEKLKSYQAQMEYLFIQDPELLDARTTRLGKIYYQQEDDSSAIRIHFEKIQRDDEEPLQARQEYLFDGVWLTRMDYALEKVDRIQQAPENEPIEAFTFIRRHFPLVGFARAEPLTEDFTISWCDPQDNQKSDEIVCLKLEPFEESRFAKDYRKILVSVSRGAWLPVRIVAENVNGDIYDIALTDPDINKKLKKSIFTIETPAHFSKNVKPLQDRKD